MTAAAPTKPDYSRQFGTWYAQATQMSLTEFVTHIKTQLAAWEATYTHPPKRAHNDT